VGREKRIVALAPNIVWTDDLRRFGWRALFYHHFFLQVVMPKVGLPPLAAISLHRSPVAERRRFFRQA